MLSRRDSMRVYTVLVALATVAVTLSSAIPKPSADDHKNRVVERGFRDVENGDHESEHHKHLPVDKHHEREKKLSDELHFGEEHNYEYDHEAFLGKEEARHFEDLTPEESKERLAKIYEKIDKDNNGLVNEEELREWIKYVQNKYILEDTERQWKEHDVNDEGFLTWDAYNKRTYGFIDDDDDDGDDTYEDMRRRDKARWDRADQDSDTHLSMDEFSNFLHPEDAEHMRDTVIDETLEDIDKDRDGKISLDEYIVDMWPNSENHEEPDWVKTEREQFATFRDKNQDGYMDREEVAHWIIPVDYDHSEAEARHLIHESDSDGDKQLTKEEVVNKYDLFVGSQATDFGDYLARHDEF